YASQYSALLGRGYRGQLRVSLRPKTTRCHLPGRIESDTLAEECTRPPLRGPVDVTLRGLKREDLGTPGSPDAAGCFTVRCGRWPPRTSNRPRKDERPWKDLQGRSVFGTRQLLDLQVVDDLTDAGNPPRDVARLRLELLVVHVARQIDGALVRVDVDL